jgi:hypothetical protein
MEFLFPFFVNCIVINISYNNTYKNTFWKNIYIKVKRVKINNKRFIIKEQKNIL